MNTIHLPLPAGVRILAEPPLFTRAVNTPSASVETLLAPFSTAQQASFYQLRDCKLSGGPATAEGIMNTNSFCLGRFPTREGIFLTTARFNHSCVPNCYHAWNSSLGMMTVHTNSEVTSGDELMLSYGDYYSMDRGHRQVVLRGRYNFACGCKACKLTGPARETSNRRRAHIAALTDGLADAVQARQYDKGVQLVERRLMLLAEEGIATPNQLYRAEFDAFQACKYGLKHKKAREWLEKAHMHSTMVEGVDSPATQRVARLMAQPLKACLNPLGI
ncbi:MAG: hypothetical protein WDW36_001726 [Sanguina aurantia]